MFPPPAQHFSDGAERRGLQRWRAREAASNADIAAPEAIAELRVLLEEIEKKQA